MVPSVPILPFVVIVPVIVSEPALKFTSYV